MQLYRSIQCIYLDYVPNTFSQKGALSVSMNRDDKVLKRLIISIIGIVGVSISNIAFAGDREIQHSNAAYASFHEAQEANRTFHQANVDELHSILSNTIKTRFSLPSTGPDFEEHFDVSGYWSFTQPGAVLVQSFGKWHILNGQICVTYADSSRSENSKCRTLWVDAGASQGLLEGSVNPVGPNKVYRVDIDRNAQPFSNTLILKLREH